MAHSPPALLKLGSHLGNRILWFDGSITVEPESLLDFMGSTSNLHVTEVTPDVAAFNLLADAPLSVKMKLCTDGIRPDEWSIPERYTTIDLPQFFSDRLDEWSGRDREIRQARVTTELDAFHAANQEIVLRLMIYIVDTLNDHNCVWGLGRGSSVACFLLYLIGVHDIDSVLFDLNFSDFMKSA